MPLPLSFSVYFCQYLSDPVRNSCDCLLGHFEECGKISYSNTVKPVLSSHSKRQKKINDRW